jgi:hypothetical protein
LDAKEARGSRDRVRILHPDAIREVAFNKAGPGPALTTEMPMVGGKLFATQWQHFGRSSHKRL